MDPALLVWPLALMIGMITPGPINLSVAALGVARGPSAAGGLAAGALAGDVILAVAVLAGAAFLNETHLLQQALTLGGGVMLAAMGMRMMLAPLGSARTLPPTQPALGVAGGLLLTLCNPKALLLHLSAAPLLLVSAAPLGVGRLAAAGATVAVLNLLALSIYLAVAGLARSERRMDRAGPLLRRLGGAGLGVSGAVLLLHAAGPAPATAIVG